MSLHTAISVGTLAILVVCLSRLLSHLDIKRDGKPLTKPPNTLPIFGNGLCFLQGRASLLSWFVECERRHGAETLQIRVPSLPAGVIISDARNLDFVFRNEAVFRKGDFFRRRSWHLFGEGIINVDGELWRAQRKAGQRFLGASTLRALADVVLPRLLGQSVDALAASEGRGRAVDLQAVLHELTTQLMGEMAYDFEMHAHDDFTLAFEYAQQATAERFQNPLWPLTEVFTRPRLRRALATVKSHGRRIVAKALADREAPRRSSGRDEVAPGSLIRCLLDSLGDESLVCDAALNFLSAGRDTTAQSLTWTFHLLMRHADVVDKLRAVMRREEARGATPTSLPYAMAIFYESLRLFPPIPFEIKQAQQDATLPDGTFLPRDSIVVWCTWAMNRSAAWGDDADSFRPERWLVDGQLVHRTAAEFPVFNGGQRSCLGQRMAELVAVKVVAALVGRFDFEPAYADTGDTGRLSRSGLTLPMEGGLPVYVSRWPANASKAS